MRRLWTLLLSGVIWASLAATAQSQEGSALYKPAPSGNSIARADRFVSEIPVPGKRGGLLNVSRKQLEAGVEVDQRSGALRPVDVARGDASERAAGGDGLSPSFGWLLGVALLTAALAASVRLSRAPSRAA
jgi:hypothetical protein